MLHVLQLLLGLGAVQPLFWLVSARSWKAFLAVSALCHFYKVRPAVLSDPCGVLTCSVCWPCYYATHPEQPSQHTEAHSSN